MNTEETLNLLKQVLTWLGGIGVAAGYLTGDQANAVANDLLVGVPAAISLVSIGWSVYSHWNMVKVPESK